MKIIKKYQSLHFYYFIFSVDNKYFFKKELRTDNQKYIEILKNEIDKYNLIKQFSFIPRILYYRMKESHYIIYEYIKGKNLSQIQITNDKQKIELLISICEILEKLHKLSIIHCDIKPENILISEENKIYLIDFGNARFIGDKTNYGSMRYCSLEQLRQEKVTVYFDIYSLGIIMYELFTGKKAYEKLDKEELIEQKKNPSLSICKEKNVPPIIDDILLKAIGCSKNNEIYVNITQMKQDLLLSIKLI